MRRRVRLGVLVHHLLALAPRRHIPVDAPRFNLRVRGDRQVPLVAVPGVSEHPPRLRVEGLIHLIEQPHHRALVARVRGQLRRDNQLKRARSKLDRISYAVSIDDLRVPPGNRLERLIGDRDGRYSIRVSRGWRLCFVWQDGDAFEVELNNHYD